MGGWALGTVSGFSRFRIVNIGHLCHILFVPQISVSQCGEVGHLLSIGFTFFCPNSLAWTLVSNETKIAISNKLALHVNLDSIYHSA